MISAIFRHLLSLGVCTLIFVPLLTVFPIFSLATPFIIWLHPSGYNYLFAEVAFWGGPWGCAFWMIFSSPVAQSRRLWKKAGYSVHEWRDDHGGYLYTLSRSVGWMFFALFFSMFAELVLFFLVGYTFESCFSPSKTELLLGTNPATTEVVWNQQAV